MQLKYAFDQSQIDTMDVTVSITMKRSEWRQLEARLTAAVGKEYNYVPADLASALRDLLRKQADALSKEIDAAAR